MRTLCIAALLGAASAASAAQAHAIIMQSDPPANGVIPPGEHAVSLRFNSRIDRARSRLTLVGPPGTETRIAVPDSGPPDIMAATAALAPGAYSLHWQVLATDGHITRGDIPFTVQAP